MPRKPKVNPQHKQIITKEWATVVSVIRQRRIALGWTQEELAEKLECEVPTIQAYEQQRRHPSIPTLLMLCKILKLKLKVE